MWIENLELAKYIANLYEDKHPLKAVYFRLEGRRSSFFEEVQKGYITTTQANLARIAALILQERGYANDSNVLILDRLDSPSRWTLLHVRRF